MRDRDYAVHRKLDDIRKQLDRIESELSEPKPEPEPIEKYIDDYTDGTMLQVTKKWGRPFTFLCLKVNDRWYTTATDNFDKRMISSQFVRWLNRSDTYKVQRLVAGQTQLPHLIYSKHQGT